MYALHQQANLFSWISFSSHPLSHKRARSKDTILSYALTFSLNIHGSYLVLCIHFRQEQNATANDEFCRWKFAIKIFPFTLGRTISQRCISSCWFIFQFICTALDKYHFLWIRHFSSLSRALQVEKQVNGARFTIVFIQLPLEKHTCGYSILTLFILICITLDFWALCETYLLIYRIKVLRTRVFSIPRKTPPKERGNSDNGRFYFC